MPPQPDLSAESEADVRYKTIAFGDIEVCWLPELEGGGRTFGQDFVPLVRHLFGRVDRVYEFCAGPGCIGFSLLAHGLCDSLVLSDVNPVAVAAARATVRRNGLEDRVTVYQSDAFADVPENERCDLLVANPPYFTESHLPYVRGAWVKPELSLRAMDPGLQLHRALYGGLGGFLNPGGSALIQECSLAGKPDDLQPMLDAGNLECLRAFWYSKSMFYYHMWVKPKLPGLLSEPFEPKRIDIELRDPTPDPMLLSSHSIYRLNLHNLTDRTVQPSFCMKPDPKDDPGHALAEIPPGGTLELFEMSFSPNRRIYFRDDDSGSILAKLWAQK